MPVVRVFECVAFSFACSVWSVCRRGECFVVATRCVVVVIHADMCVFDVIIIVVEAGVVDFQHTQQH